MNLALNIKNWSDGGKLCFAFLIPKVFESPNANLVQLRKSGRVNNCQWDEHTTIRKVFF
ncbi:hypothetical protein [Rhodonellum sp.]|uniref:hypothetical protein n=1 Tax=Rhodonellum sp. TaxID=2231180 RepID=UPI002721ED79|nr:hypothetical protein [Rhodonellum sp.]MDO9551374.1 hypothetical protein [Rhodonellum sp.]